MDLVETYFARAADPDQEAYVALFAPDVVVTDDGRTWRGRDDVRRWRADVPEVSYEVTSVVATDGGAEAVARVSGDFPGSPVSLRFAFDHDGAGLITALRIGP